MVQSILAQWGLIIFTTIRFKSQFFKDFFPNLFSTDLKPTSTCLSKSTKKLTDVWYGTLAKTKIIYPKNMRAKVAMDFTQYKFGTPWQLKKSKSLEPFWSYQLLTALPIWPIWPSFEGKWAGLAGLPIGCAV